MHDEAKPDKHRSDEPGPVAPGGIAALTEEECEMLREFAGRLRDHDVHNPVAREALDRAAEQLERASVSPVEQD